MLWESGCTVSNKVLECLVLRFAKNRVLTTENYVMAMVRLHLAHGKIVIVELRVINLISLTERHHSIDSKIKSNPLSLEEVSNFLFGYSICSTSINTRADLYLF